MEDQPKEQLQQQQQNETPQGSSSDYYFDSYSHFGIHEEMLKDEVRTTSYRNAIYRNRHLFEGKVVLDIGCGTGILSMFAATAGAKLVIGVDMSGMLDHAKKIVEANGLSSKIVLLKGKMEEVQLPVDKVDIIISEWMGYFLLYESMLDTVLWARDRYLEKGGLILPNRADMVIGATEDAQYKQQKIHFWEDVYGFDMSCMKPLVMKEPLVDIVDPKLIVSSENIFKTIDIMTVTKEDLSFKVPFSVRMEKTECVHAMTVWFDIAFDIEGMTKPIYFGTGPDDRYTHWKQTVLYLPEDLLDTKEGDEIKGTLECRPNAKNPRDLDLTLEYGVGDKPTTIYKYHMC